MQNHRSFSQLAAHVPLDRLYALLGAPDLPPEAAGSVLFADLAGFTPLTERLLRAFGARRGAEELTGLLDLVYERLIAGVQRHGGSVIGFSGDAITCWFPGADALPALACGLAMQQAMAAFAAYQLAPDQLVALTLKVAIASGRVQRFVVGDPAVQLIDILAGEPLRRLAALDPLARPGEVIVDRPLAARLHASLTIQEWRAADSGEQGAIVTAVRPAAPLAVHAPALPPDLPAGIEQWVAPGVLARLQDQQQPFLTELRPTIAVFVSFSGASEYDLPAQADLDRYIRWVQQILLRYEATLIQVSIGEKGNYLYASFGAPLAHEDDAIRAVRAALELRDSPQAVRTERIGIAEGIARSGVYGSATRRTYGVLGDAVNLAARLMQAAGPGQILASDQVWSATGDHVQWDLLPPLTVKGKQTPLLVASLGGPRALPAQPSLGALVGRAAELGAMQSRLGLARQGAGQLLLITGEAGIGKSRLTREAPRLLGETGVLLAGATQSYATASPYLCWAPIWQAIFGVAPAEPLAANLRRVAAALGRLAPRLLPQLPLLAGALSLPIPENDLTRPLDAQGRKERLETLLATSLRAYAGELAASGQCLLLVLEDLHWIDALSADLLRQLAPLVADLPVAIVATARPVAEAEQLVDGLAELPHAAVIALAELSPAAVSDLLDSRLPLEDGGATPGRERLIAQIHARANGNPFYVEELIRYLITSDVPIDERYGWQQRDLPIGLHRLVLSRIDRLGERQQRVLKTASVLGGSFPRRWLWESYPALGAAADVQADLAALERSDLLAAADDPELCHFKHAITREVTYESLGRGARAQLHEQCAAYLEQGRPAGEEPLDLLAYHYEQSRNDAKAVEYLARNAARAMRLFANEAAADQYRRAIQRAGQAAAPLPMVALERGLGDVYAQMAEFDPALTSYDQALADLPADAALARAEIAILKADVLVRATRFEEAVALIEATEAMLYGLAPAGAKLPPAARVLLARLAELRSIKSQRQGDLPQALKWSEQGLIHIAHVSAANAQVAATRIRLYQAAAAAAMNVNNLAKAKRMLRNGFRLIKRHPYPAMEAELHLRHALILQRSEQLGAAIRQFLAVLPLMEATGTRDRLAYVLLPGGQSFNVSGAYAEAEAWLTRGVQLGKATDSAFLICAGLSVLCSINNHTGNWNAVLEYSAEGRSIAERHNLRSLFLEFLLYEGQIRLYRGEFASATAFFQQLQTYGDQYPSYRTIAQRYLAYGAFMAGNIDQAVESMRGSVVGSTSIISTQHAFDVLGIAEWWVLLQANHVPLGHDEALLREAVANSILFWQRRGYRSHLPYAWRVQAMLDWHANRLENACVAIERGLSIARHIGEVPEQARCLFWRAKIAAATDRVEKALGDLHESASMFAALGAWPEHSMTQRLMRAPNDRSIVL